MAIYEVKKINIKWVFTTMSVIFAIVGVIIGFFTFFIFPTEPTITLNIGQKFLALLIFIVLYTIIMDLGILITITLYNLVSPNTGGITLSLEQKEE